MYRCKGVYLCVCVECSLWAAGWSAATGRRVQLAAGQPHPTLPANALARHTETVIRTQGVSAVR